MYQFGVGDMKQYEQVKLLKGGDFRHFTGVKPKAKVGLRFNLISGICNFELR
jgi:hypothetical protein